MMKTMAFGLENQWNPFFENLHLIFRIRMKRALVDFSLWFYIEPKLKMQETKMPEEEEKKWTNVINLSFQLSAAARLKIHFHTRCTSAFEMHFHNVIYSCESLPNEFLFLHSSLMVDYIWRWQMLLQKKNV